MDNRSNCPRCGKIISKNKAINSTVNHFDPGSSLILCSCRGNDYLLGCMNPPSRKSSSRANIKEMVAEKDIRKDARQI